MRQEMISIGDQIEDHLGTLINGASSESLHNPPENVPMQLPRLIELATEKYEKNSYMTITNLRLTAANMHAVAQELLERAAQLEADRAAFPGTIRSAVEYEIYCAQLVDRFRLIRPKSE